MQRSPGLAMVVIAATAIAVSHLSGIGARHVQAASDSVVATTTDQADGESTFWLSYHYTRDAQKLLRYLSGQSLSVSADRPMDLKLPDAFAPRMRYAQWSTPMDPTGFRHVALARSEQSELCDQLIIDTNGDGQLDDELVNPPYHLRPYGRGRGQVYFGPVALQFDSPDGPIQYHLNFEVYCSGPDQYHIQAIAGGWYEGAVVLDGKATACQLIDYNANGVFNDTCAEGAGYASADRVRFAVDPNVEPVFAGRYVREGDKFYEFTAAKDGAFVTIRSSDEVTTGTLTSPDDFRMVKVFGPQGSFTAETEATQRVPSGKYRMVSWQREVPDESGRIWRFSGRGFPEHATFDVATNDVTELKLGEPWVAKLSDRARGRKHSIEQTFVGRYGERVDASYANGRRPPAPRLQITSADGDYEKTFKFEYG